MKKIITIVGCGAVGAAQLYHLVYQLIQDNITEHFEILVFEKSENLGHGLAYTQDEHTNLLNRSAETMSLIHRKEDDFKNWLLKNKSKWKEEFSGHKIKRKEVFLARALFGSYCEDTIQKIIVHARAHKLKVSIIHDEVIVIDKYNHDYKIETRNGWKFHSHVVILTLGNLPSLKFGKAVNNDKFYTSPYPTKKLSNIPAHSAVGIMGSLLSAIDAAIALHHQEHQGNIAFISRGGWLPVVRSPYRYHELKILNAKALREYLSLNKRELSLRQIIKLLRHEVELLCDEKIQFGEWLATPIDAKLHFEHEFKTYKSKNKIAWQAVMIALNQVIESIWHELNEADKALFNLRYKSKFMAYRVGIPIQNARKIYNLFVTKQISQIRHFESLAQNQDKFIVTTSKSTFEFDYIIDATGYCDDLTYIQSTLLSNMTNNGLIKPHRYGGLEVDFESSRIVRKDNSIEKNLYAIGNLTSGTYFFTSVLELNIKHAYKIAQNIALDFIGSHRAPTAISGINCSPTAFVAQTIDYM